MREANNNEIDLLLRSLAGRRGASPSADAAFLSAEPQIASDHLDADELNSYAEGVAPEAARARYTEHLADCETCRGLIAGLTQASGAANRYELPERSGGLTFLEKLGALFSQPVWRYALPAMVLTTVIGIGLFAVLQQRRADFVAQNESPGTQPPGQAGTSSTLAPTTSQQSKPDNRVPSPTPPVAAMKERDALQTEKGQSGQEDRTALADLPKAVPAKDADAAGESGLPMESGRSDRLESKIGPPAPPPAPADGQKSAAVAKEQPAKRADQDRSLVDVYQVQSEDVHGPNRSRNNTSPPASQRNVGAMAGRGPSGIDKKKTAEPETRSVMGRHFAREGGAWVDTAYEPSQAALRLARGSEQYRALVADEPGIRTIAEQLDGVVIVVWKGRAYRIQ